LLTVQFRSEIGSHVVRVGMHVQVAQFGPIATADAARLPQRASRWVTLHAERA
jgi:hypothetical protein